MTRYRTPIFLLVLALAVGGGGCAGFRQQSGVVPVPQQDLTSTKPVPSKAVDDNENMLAAVEDFLERTAEYATLPQGDRPDSPQSTSAKGSQVQTVAERFGGEPAALQTPAPGGLRIVENRTGSSFAPDASVVANAQVAIEAAQPYAPTLALPVVQSISIRGFDDPRHGHAPTPPSRTTNAPLEAHSVDTPDLPDRFIDHLKARAVEHDDFNAEWSYRLALLATHRDGEASRVSADLSEDHRGLLQSLIELAKSVRRVAADPVQATEQATFALEALREVLIKHADPVVSAVTLCRKVVTFGVYEELLPNDFVSGRTLQMIVYLELRNFNSNETDDDQFETRLATRIELLTAAGVSVWRHEEPEIVDRCRRRRKDFFIAQRIALPPTLSAGDYVLKVLVEDKLTGRADEATYPIVLVSPVSLATGH